MINPLILLMAVLGFLAAALVLVYHAASAAVWCVARVGSGAAKLIGHSLAFVKNEALEAVQTAGALLSSVAITPLALGNLAIGRWASAKHYGRALKEEGISSLAGLYRLALANPLRFVGLGSIVNRVEGKLPGLLERAPRHGRRLGGGYGAGRLIEPPPLEGSQAPRAVLATAHIDNAFDGYEVVGELPAGGSGARLFLARPLSETTKRLEQSGVEVPDQVVIKSFAIAAGSTLPQIVREGRALEAARRLGLVLQHSLDEERFWYVMPYVRGRELGDVTTALHVRSGPEGLDSAGLKLVASYTNDVLNSLSRFHEDGLWHKDVKPSNVMVSEDVAHLVDLGLVTPLASAMTLTTHGTEYYRDPELVRQALRGAKVNEVDGVKFDLYAVGALLYSMVENSFPAHGSLSRINKRCPDSLAFIQRRAMADLSDRYSSAAEMRDDLALLLAARDPFAVMPADLPSFRKAMSEEQETLSQGHKQRRSSGSRTLRAGAPSPKKAQANGSEETVGMGTAGVATLDPEPKQRRRSRQGLATFGLMFCALIALTKIMPAIFDNPQVRGTGQRVKAMIEGHQRLSARQEEDEQRAWEQSAQALAEAERDDEEAQADRWQREFPGLFSEGAANGPFSGQSETNVLVLSDVSKGSDDLHLDPLATLLEESGFGVFGSAVDRPEPNDSIDLEAAARISLGLQSGISEEAFQRLQEFLDAHDELSAVIWIVPGQEGDALETMLVLPDGVLSWEQQTGLVREHNGTQIRTEKLVSNTVSYGVNN